MVGNSMHCPKCMKVSNVLAFRPLRIAENFQDEQNPIIKCPLCGWVFSPRMSLEELTSIVEQWKAAFASGDENADNIMRAVA